MSRARTERPTPRRLLDARRRGQVARSGELTNAVALCAGLAAIAVSGPSAVLELSTFLRDALAEAAGGRASLHAIACDALLRLARLAAPLLVIPALAASAAGALQTAGFAGLEHLLPRSERLDPLEGLRRLLSAEPLLRAGLGLAKVAIAGGLLWGWVAGNGSTLAQLPRLGVEALWRSSAAGSLALRLAIAALSFGLLDLALVRRRHLRALMMTRDEVRREAREDDGVPEHRAERRRLHQALLDAGPVSKATVVIVNPTHVAVALLHRRDREDAPRLLAKGVGEDAARIRSAARRAGVPIVRDAPLARALYRLAEAGEEVPGELYEAAAGVLVHVYGIGREVT